MSFEYALSTIQQNTFQINIYGKNITLKFNENSINWVKEYKPSEVEESEKLRKKFQNINSDIFLFIYYVYKFILPDFNYIEKYFPSHNEKYLELGAGIGIFAVILDHLLEGKIILNLVEVEVNMDHSSKFNIRYKLDEKRKIPKIFPLKLLKEFLDLNNTKAKVFSPEEIKKSNLTGINYVFSSRSYCYLYDIEEYSSFLSRAMAADAKIICDVVKEYDQVNKFKKEFFFKKTLAENDYFARIFAMKNFDY
jgi:hypothetical protein